MEVVFFIYGLAFFVLGFGILIYPKKGSRYELVKDLWLLAAFGISHGMNEWLDLFHMMRAENVSSLAFIRGAVLPVSFLFLLLFGAKSIARKGGKGLWFRALPFVFPAAFVVVLALSTEKLLAGDVWARYLLGVPGTVLASYALIVHQRILKNTGERRTVRNLRVASVVFLLYGLFAGIVVPGTGSFAPSLITYDIFIDAVGIPVQVFRTLCAVVIAYCMIQVLGLFEWERMAALRDSRDNLEERVEQRTAELMRLNEELEDEITERVYIEQQLKMSLEEKEVLFREIHHRVKNNLQIMISLLNLGIRHVKNQDDVRLFMESRDRVKSMSLIHDKLYLSEDLANLDPGDYIGELVRSLFRAYSVDTNQIRFSMDVRTDSIDMDTAVPFGLIVSELVTNCIKHAFAGTAKGTIQLILQRLAEDELELAVCDNGVGMPEWIDYRRAETLGLQIVSMLAETQLHGKIDMKVSGGTEFRIRFKELAYSKRI